MALHTAIPATPITLGATGATPTIPTIATTTRIPSAAELQLKLALRVAAYSHTYSMCQSLGIYPT